MKILLFRSIILTIYVMAPQLFIRDRQFITSGIHCVSHAIQRHSSLLLLTPTVTWQIVCLRRITVGYCNCKIKVHVVRWKYTFYLYVSISLLCRLVVIDVSNGNQNDGSFGCVFSRCCFFPKWLSLSFVWPTQALIWIPSLPDIFHCITWGPTNFAQDFMYIWSWWCKCHDQGIFKIDEASFSFLNLRLSRFLINSFGHYVAFWQWQ